MSICLVDLVVTCLKVTSRLLQDDMLHKKREEFERSIVKMTSWDGFVAALDDKKMVMTPWCVCTFLTLACLCLSVGSKTAANFPVYLQHAACRFSSAL